MASWNSATSVCIGSDFGVTMVGLMASILSLSVLLVMKHDSSLVEDAMVKLELLEMEPLLLLGSSLWFLLVLSTCSVVTGSCLQLGCQTNCWRCVGSWCLWLQLVVFLGSSWVLTTASCDVCQSVWLHQIQQIQRPNAWWSLMNANNQLHRLLSSTGGIPTLCFAQPEHPRGGWTTLEPRLHGWITDLDGIPLAAKAVFIERLCTGLNCCQLTVGDLGDDWCWMMRSVVCRWHNPHCNPVWLWRVNFRCFIRIWLMIIDLWACSPCSIVRTNESTVETFVGLWGFLTDNLLFKFEFVFLFHKKVQLQFQIILHAADPDFAQN